MKIARCLVLLCLSTAGLYAYTFTVSAPKIEIQTNFNSDSDTIPFLLTEYNNMVIEAVLNDSDTLSLMFHTAVSSISLTTEAISKITSLQKGKSTNVESWGGSTNTEYIEKNRLSIGNFSWDDQTIWKSERSGHFTDGKFGPNLFGDKIIEIDFENQVIIVHSDLPSIDDQFQQHELSFDRGTMFIKATYAIQERTFSNHLMIHSGYGGTILLDDAFSSQNEIGKKLETISEKELKDSYGNTIKTKKAMMPVANIAGYAFENLPIGFFEGSIGNQQTSVLGSEILKRFHIILDMQQAQIYLKPNKLMSTPIKNV